MLKYVNHDIVFQEIPDEVTLAINLSGCPYRCKGCHSPVLQEDTGEVLDEAVLSRLLQVYGKTITCVCFMGGDANTGEVCELAKHVRENWQGAIKTAWYSGKDSVRDQASACFDFVKTGPYIEALGGLDKKTTNQRLYRVNNGHLIDITSRLQK